MQEDKNYNEVLHTMKLIIDSITKDSAEQQGSLDFGDENSFIDEGIFREVDGEFVLDMYVLKGLNYSNLDTMMLLMPEHYTQVDIHEEDEEYFGLDVDGAIGKVLDTFPSIEGFQVRYFKLPDYAYLPEEVGGVETSLFVELEEQEEDVISNYVDREYFEELMGYEDTLDDVVYDFIQELDALGGFESDEEYYLDDEYELDDDATIDLYLFEGVDFDKVEEDNLDLDDTENYIKVEMTDDDLEAIGVDVGSMLTQFGIDKGDSEVNYKVLPKEYYLKPEEGGYPYPHLLDNSVTVDEQQDNTEEPYNQLKGLTEQVMGDYEDWLGEMEGEVKSELGVDISKVNDKMVKMLEKLRQDGNEDSLHKLNMEYINSYFTEYSQRPVKVRGYYVTTDVELGVRTKTVHIMVDVEGVEDVWVFSYTGVYENKGNEDVYKYLEKHHKDANEFNLDRVVSIPEEELSYLIDEDLV